MRNDPIKGHEAFIWSVADRIPFTYDGTTVRRYDGTTVLTKRGHLRVEWDWSPDLDRLQATSYRYLRPVLDEP